MARPVLGDLELQQVQLVAVDQDQVLHRHEVAALEGDFLQRLGRRATSVSLAGVLTGAEAAAALGDLRLKFRAAEPVSFVADIATATRVDNVLIEELRVRELAGRPERFAYAITIREFIPPPTPVTEEPPEPPPEPPEPNIERNVGTLVVEVTADEAPDLDPSQATVTVTQLPAGEGLTRVLSDPVDAVWTDTNMPAGSFTVEATVTQPRPASGSAAATIQAGQTTQVSIPLGPAAVVAQLFVVHFWFDKAFVEPCMRQVLREIVDYARAHSSEKLLIVGHTDKTGSARYNQSLSERRARAVHAHLIFGRDAANRANALAELEAIRQRQPPDTVDTVADNWDLREAQHMLQDLNFYPGHVDGQDGPLTQEAIRAYRCQNGLPPGTTMDDAVWRALIEDYVAQDSFAVPVSQFLPNCAPDVLRWLGCGEEDPVLNVAQAARQNRRVELLFVPATALPCSVPQPVTFDMPAPGAGGNGWCLNPAGATDRCCFLNKAVRPCSSATATQWCRPPTPPTFTVRGLIQREVRQADGTMSLQPFANARFVLIDPRGKIDGSEDGRGVPVPTRARPDGTFEFTDRGPGVYTLEVRENGLVRRLDQTDADVRGDSVCRSVQVTGDEVRVVAIEAPVMREIRLPTSVHVMRALHPTTRDLRTCPRSFGAGLPFPQASALSDAEITAAFDVANVILRQIRVRADPVQIVREAYAHPIRTACEIDDQEFALLLSRCAYDAVLNVFFVGDLAGGGEAGFGASLEDNLALGLTGCAVGDRFQTTLLGPPIDMPVDAQQREEVLAHEIGHYLNLEHVDPPTPADAGRLMLAETSIGGDNRTLVPAEAARARASLGAARECQPLTLSVTGATQVDGSFSDRFIAHRSTNPADVVTIDAVISPELQALGTVTMTGGAPGAGPQQQILTRSVTGSADITATFTPTAGGTPVTRRVRISVVDFSLTVTGATQVPATTTFVIGTDPAALVTVEAVITPAPFCIPLDLVTWSGGDTVPDPLRRTVSRSAGGSTTVDATLAGETQSVTIVVARVMLDVDADRDGTVGVDEAGKDAWEFGAGKKGAVIVANVDNDNAAAGNTEIDNENDVVDGAGDVSDLAELVVRDPGVPLPAGMSLVLRTSDRTKVRVFDQRTAGRTAVLGPSPLPATFTLPAAPAGDRVFGIEATQFPDTGFDGLVDLTLELRQGAAVLTSDVVRVRVAPWVMPSHLDPTEELYVVRTSDNAAFVADVQAVATGAGIPLRRASGTTYGGDRWMQDTVEIGYGRMPSKSNHVALNAIRFRGLEPFARGELLGVDYGFKEVTTGASDTTFDAHGNLEVSPPVTVGPKEFKLGRIYHGSGRPGELFNAEMDAFLQAQLVQAPFAVNTGWLGVGHVDEVISFVPSNVGRPFRLLLADTREAVTLLTAVQAAGNGSARILSGTRAPFQERSVDDLLSDAGLLARNSGVCQPQLDTMRATLLAELGLVAADVVTIPTLFVEESFFPGVFAALSPGLVNMLVITGSSFAATRLVLPKAFGPVVGGVDQLEKAVRDKLTPLGYAAAQLAFVDDYDTYHVLLGEVHCGTNSKRQPPATPWWEQEP